MFETPLVAQYALQKRELPQLHVDQTLVSPHHLTNISSCTNALKQANRFRDWGGWGHFIDI
jgi:hypothetical protein